MANPKKQPKPKKKSAPKASAPAGKHKSSKPTTHSPSKKPKPKSKATAHAEAGHRRKASSVSKTHPPAPRAPKVNKKSSSAKSDSKSAAKSAPKPEAKASKSAAAAKSSAKSKATPAKSAKTSPAKTPPAKPAPVKAEPKPAPAKPAPKPEHKAAAPAKSRTASEAPKSATNGRDKSRAALRTRILERKTLRPATFSLDEALQIATANAARTAEAEKHGGASKAKSKVVEPAAPIAPNRVGAASLADILGFNPRQAQKAPAQTELESVPEKWRRFYKALLDLRAHVTGQLDTHTEETLKRSAKDDAGDLSSYGQHMADAGTDTFDRDFALSMVASEQEALSEIEAAIQRIRAGTYGTCEATGQPISRERLMAVPFTRYSTEAQREIERNRMRTRTAAGLLGEFGEDGGSKGDDDGGDE